MTLNDRIRERVDSAKEILNKMHMPANPTVIFDIDDTLINSFGATIKPILELYNYVKMLCITPVIITNRMNEQMVVEYTMYELESHGINGYHEIYFRDPDETDLVRAKLLSRKKVTEKGFDIVMSIGDQKCDIGAFGGVGIILPSIHSDGQS